MVVEGRVARRTDALVSSHETVIVGGGIAGLACARRLPYRQHPFLLITESGGGRIRRSTDGSAKFWSASDNPDFANYFAASSVVEHVAWAPAFHLVGDVLLKLEQGPGLFSVGDHNVCTLEDAYLTGLYAANRILGQSAGIGMLDVP